MTTSKNILKVPDGKLIKLFLDYEDSVICDIKITGDFFVYPEESIEALEKKLAGAKLDKDALTGIIEEFVESKNIELFGITTPALVEAILGAVQ